jgi:hypothetical protein
VCLSVCVGVSVCVCVCVCVRARLTDSNEVLLSLLGHIIITVRFVVTNVRIYGGD